MGEVAVARERKKTDLEKLCMQVTISLTCTSIKMDLQFLQTAIRKVKKKRLPASNQQRN